MTERKILGTALGNIVKAELISFNDLSGYDIAIDAFNSIYAFLAIIRQPDGKPLIDHKGRITSHLSGLLYRNVRLIEYGIRPVYVFDGEPPKLKTGEIKRRREIRETAHQAWQAALKEGRTEDAYKAAQASTRINTSIIEESKELIEAMGIPVIQAPSEGEALAAQMAQDGLVWASASQDNDSLLYGTPRMIRNLVGRRTPRSKSATTIPLEKIDLEENLQLLGLTREQLIDLAILIGTDYNTKIQGVGPKTALKLVLKHGTLEEIEKAKNTSFDFPYPEIRDIFLNPPKVQIERPLLSVPKIEDVRRILCTEHDFSVARVERALERLENAVKSLDSAQQSSLTDFF
jgi:flap endonuclease-1